MRLSSPLRGGLIGCGYVSQYHLEAWKTVPNARIVALCDRDPERLERAGRILPGQAYRDAAELLSHEHLDFVELCTGPESHRELVALAARHGVHVLCQKPSAAVRSDLQAMIASCAAGSVRLMIHENWRFRPWYRTLKRELESGTIGRPIRLRLAHRDTRALRPDGFRDQPYFATMPRLILIEMGCHLVDTARYLLGEVETVSATVGRFGAGHIGEDLATLSLGFASGAIGLLDMTWCAPPDVARPEWALNETAVEGSEGLLKLQTDGSLLRIGLDGTTEQRLVPLKSDDRVYVDGYAQTQDHFIEGLLQDTPHETSGTDNLKTMDIIWAGYSSAEEGRLVRLRGD
ncbi:Predicted dehydrogenase [Singulisphaera sp. GP187]|uniref:Gfo/Idh/MocA family protein n=1 Tax=Singulisphaera sp. GP187 TaxID=1882752 RepID=UPI000926512F|nr:Gfo/Idh/MocA family oxidoreductase [Singulisphaera sp. GP187]SIN78727.1 Predicted dehydrogenase [Singulisphaera sp. GP187]